MGCSLVPLHFRNAISALQEWDTICTITTKQGSPQQTICLQFSQLQLCLWSDFLWILLTNLICIEGSVILGWTEKWWVQTEHLDLSLILKCFHLSPLFIMFSSVKRETLSVSVWETLLSAINGFTAVMKPLQQEDEKNPPVKQRWSVWLFKKQPQRSFGLFLFFPLWDRPQLCHFPDSEYSECSSFTC